MGKRLDIEIGLESFHVLFKNNDHQLFTLTKRELSDYLTCSHKVGCMIEVFIYSHHRKFIWSPHDLDKFRNFFHIVYNRFPQNVQTEEAVDFSLNILGHLNPEEKPIQQIISLVDEPRALACSRVASNLHFFDTKSDTAFFFIRKETSQLYRLSGIMNGLMFVLSHRLICHGGLLLHGATVQKNDKAVLFLGLSGAGKSTITHLCRPDACFSDDGVIIRKEGGQIHAFRSPFRQIKRKEKCPDCMRGRVRKVFLLEKDECYNIVQMKKNELMHIILLNLIHFFKYMTDETVGKGFWVVKEMVDMLRVYRLHFPKASQMWDDIWE